MCVSTPAPAPTVVATCKENWRRPLGQLRQQRRKHMKGKRRQRENIVEGVADAVKHTLGMGGQQRTAGEDEDVDGPVYAERERDGSARKGHRRLNETRV